MSEERAMGLSRKVEVHQRLLAAYAKLDADDKRRAFRKALGRAVKRSEQSVARWVGDRAEFCSPTTGSLPALERWLDGGCK